MPLMRVCVAVGVALAVHSVPPPAAAASELPQFAQVVAQYRASDVRIQDRHGQPLQRVRVDYAQRRGDWVTLDQISPALQRAVLMSEDQRFHAHGGVDWMAAAGAAWDWLFDGTRRGASTITMQLAGLLAPELARQAGGRSVMQKWQQALQAGALEADWSKAQILEAYLNLVPFRGELVGVDALARTLFRKHPAGLDLAESALAAVMLRGPNVAPQVMRQRACALLLAMQAPQSCLELGLLAEMALGRAHLPLADQARLAPHFSRLLLETRAQPAGAVVRSSLDADLQRFVLESIGRQLHFLRHARVRDAAVVVLENRSGQVLAYAGSSGAWSDAAQVDHARALRQAGSALKPFLYAQALSQQRITAASLLQDSPLNLPTGSGMYIPRNYDEGFSGWVSVRTALAASLNIPAVRVLTMVGADGFAELLRQLGLPLTRDGDYYGYSLALGSADVSLLTLTNAYRSLANLGRHTAWSVLAAGNDPANPASGQTSAAATLISPGAAWIVGDILADRHARARTFGLDSPLSTPFWTAVKTGTSKDMRDNWTVGWSDRHTVGVWVGNTEGASMRDVSGVSGAGPIWHDVMRYLHDASPSRAPEPPPVVTRVRVDFADGLEPSRTEAFLGDTAITEVSLAEDARVQDHAARIQFPAQGEILAIDPDIPMRNQRVLLRMAGKPAEGRVADVQWWTGGSVVAQGPSAFWLPREGRHRIELRDGAGNPLDAVTVQVRGMARR